LKKKPKSRKAKKPSKARKAPKRRPIQKTRKAAIKRHVPMKTVRTKPAPKVSRGGKFYITTPIYYVNDVPHIGHAYTTIVADALARWHRLYGQDVFFLTGTDENGKKVESAAREAGKPPKEFADSVVKRFQEAWKALGISNDDFIRTTDERHRKTVEQVIRLMQKAGDIYLGMYEGWYCVPDETFWTETQLVNGKCPECGRPVEMVKEASYFFRLSKYQDALLEFYRKNPDFISPKNRRQEIINRVQAGLKDLSITRETVKWGIPFPINKKHIVYVWVDALTNYLSAIDYPGPKFRKYWPADIHLMAKEILWFHAVIWPAMLMSCRLPLPKKVFAHGWLTIEGEKMSKSRGNVVDPIKLTEKYPLDAVRYFLVREIPLGDDGDFSEKALIQRINGELVSDLGNLASRVLTLAERCKSFQGKDELSKNLNFAKIQAYVDKVELHHAIMEIFAFVRSVNKYINQKEPWKLEGKELESVLYNLLESLRVISILISPFMPGTSEKLNRQLGVKAGTFRELKFRAKFEGKPKKGEHLFGRIK
jgi:methionyl-tRNA synthetase